MASADEFLHNPAFCVGVTGHRRGRLARMDEPQLRQRLHDVLAWIGDQRNVPSSLQRLGLNRPAGTFGSVALLSALAEGADQIAAEEALRVDYTLWCALPFSRAEYEADFSTPESRSSYRYLLAQAAEVEELHGTRANTEAAYADVGQRVVACANVLLAIWDGDGAHGPGGTAAIVEVALAAGRPVIWIDACTPHDVRLITDSRQSVPLDITDWFVR